jgi:ribulose-phosphate 3-epimerase
MTHLPVTIAASLACANYLHLEEDLRALESAGVEYLHIDIMDGQFVPNFALNMDHMRAARQVTSLPMDVHLMVERPERYLERFVAAGASIVAVHQECVTHLQRTLAEIRRLGAAAGVALNPATPLDTLEYVMEDVDFLLLMTVNPGSYGQKLVPSALRKIADARAMCQRHGREIPICVDGNVSFEHAPKMVAAGANFLVGGTSSIFATGLTIAEGARKLRELVLHGRHGP